MQPIKVEIGQYYKTDGKTALKAIFAVVIYPLGQKIIDCKYFEQGDKRWFSFPTKDIKKDGKKTEYIPLVSYLDKKYLEDLKTAIMAQLAMQENLSESKETTQEQAHPLQDNASSSWYK